MNISERVKHLRKDILAMTQDEFAKSINLSRSNLCNIEVERINVTERVIYDICDTYGISEVWLRTGEGDIYPPKSDDEELAKMFGELFTPDTDPRIKKAVKATIEMLKRLPEDAIPIIGDYAEQIADALKKEQD